MKKLIIAILCARSLRCCRFAACTESGDELETVASAK